jgi:hypothetical protein
MDLECGGAGANDSAQETNPDIDLYLHGFFVTDDGKWTVVQQGMKNPSTIVATDARDGRSIFFQDVIAMFHFFAHMRIAFDAEARNEADHRLIGFTERVARAAAHGGDDGGHIVSPCRNGSVRLDARELDHLAPLLGLLGDELPEVGGRARKDWAGQFGKPRLDLGIGGDPC